MIRLIPFHATAGTSAIRLPRWDPAGGAWPLPPPVAAAPIPGLETLHAAPSSLRELAILAVDDDRTTLELTGLIFEEHGAHVTCVDTAEDALSALAAAPLGAKGFGLLLSDIGLPGMDGYALLRYVRRELQIPPNGLPAIAVTAFARAEDRQMALRAGFQAHLPKPWDAEQLVAMSLRLIAQAARSGF